MTAPKNVLIVDGNAVCYAAHYGVGGLSRRDGGATGVIYGFFSMLQLACRATKSAHIAFCWDSRQSHRRRIFPGYKGDRKQKDPSLVESFTQFNAIRDVVLPRLGFANNFLQTGFEADDLIASLCRFSGPEEDQHYYILSSDNDLYQLLTASISMYKPMKGGSIYTRQDFFDEYRIDPLFWSAVKAIAGCTTDCVPGIDGVGVKTAVKHILEGGLHKKIDTKEGRAIVERNKPLVVLPFNGTPKYHLDWEHLPSYAEWLEVCTEYEFQSFLRSPETWERIFAGVAPMEAKDRVVIGKPKRSLV